MIIIILGYLELTPSKGKRHVKTNDTFQRLKDLRSIYLYEVCVSSEDGKRLSPDEILIEDALNPDEIG